jgi:hypothetical protein
MFPFHSSLISKLNATYDKVVRHAADVINKCRSNEANVAQEMQTELEKWGETEPEKHQEIGIKIHNFLTEKYNSKYWAVFVSGNDTWVEKLNKTYQFHTAVANGRFAAAISTTRRLDEAVIRAERQMSDNWKKGLKTILEEAPERCGGNNCSCQTNTKSRDLPAEIRATLGKIGSI